MNWGKNKYHAQKIVVDGFTFHSKKEANHYQMLKLLQKDGQLRYFLRQVPFHLPGGGTYRCDFLEVYPWGNRFVDVKGYQTAESKRIIKIVEGLYPVKIEIVR